MNTTTEIIELSETEQKLDNAVLRYGESAQTMKIVSAEDYAHAAEELKNIKRVKDKVKEYWEPMRASAKEAYDAVLAKKKEMTEPLDNAEKIVKKKMADYNLELERKRKELEEEMRRKAQEAAERSLQAAVSAEEAGDTEASESAMMEAEMYESSAKSNIISVVPNKVEGISTRKNWKARIVDSSLVPLSVAGVEIRPVDLKAVEKLVKASNGQIIIPGIVIEQEVVISARA